MTSLKQMFSEAPPMSIGLNQVFRLDLNCSRFMLLSPARDGRVFEFQICAVKTQNLAGP